MTPLLAVLSVLCLAASFAAGFFVGRARGRDEERARGAALVSLIEMRGQRAARPLVLANTGAREPQCGARVPMNPEQEAG